jgi:hypothetical protein
MSNRVSVTRNLSARTEFRRQAALRRRRRERWAIAAIVVWIAAVAVAAIWFDLAFFLVGGIDTIVRGAQAHPVSVNTIAWGAVRCLCTGFGVVVGFLIGWAGVAVIVNWADQ